eukprot:TRINITY_DN15520_c0_g1_i1.p1 TRINITY_DN15520_c0_g1~~TRINITY_DN15520_c0_g1_i1.p1  ORF type:complete len:169 (-),score=29.00 TRINITY_DN15520_c0_g1_i1:64-570(-)
MNNYLASMFPIIEVFVHEKKGSISNKFWKKIKGRNFLQACVIDKSKLKHDKLHYSYKFPGCVLIRTFSHECIPKGCNIKVAVVASHSMINLIYVNNEEQYMREEKENNKNLMTEIGGIFGNIKIATSLILVYPCAFDNLEEMKDKVYEQKLLHERQRSKIETYELQLF